MRNLGYLVKEHIREYYALAKLQGELITYIPSSKERNYFLKRFNVISKNIDCPHNDSHILTYLIELFKVDRNVAGCIVEAGAYKGSSTAKLSIIAKALNRKLYVFDSFEGLPENSERHNKSINGYSIKNWFGGHGFKGALEEVKYNIENYGEIEVCEFVKGWFKDTLQKFNEPIVGAILDVDLAESTKVCIKYLYPLICRGGFLCSQDGDFPLVIKVFEDDAFWEKEVRITKPNICGLGVDKILTIYK